MNEQILYLDAIRAFQEINGTSEPDAVNVVAKFFTHELSEGNFILPVREFVACISS